MSKEGNNASALLKEANDLKEKNPREALNKVEEALAVSIIRNDWYQEAQCYIFLGEINESIQEWKLALENFKLAYEKAGQRKIVDAELTKRSLLGLGNCYMKLQQYPEALDRFSAYSRLSRTAAEKITAQLNISEVHFLMGDYAQALEAAERAESMAMKTDNGTEVKIQNQKAKVYAQLNQLEKATDLFNSSQNTLRSKAAQERTEAGNSLESAKEEIIDAMRSQNRYDDEIQLRNQSIEYNLESKNLKEVTKDKVELGKVLAAKGETVDALKELEEAANIADTINSPKEQAKAFLALADLYEKNNRTDRALRTYKRYSDAVERAEEQTQTTLTEKSALITKQRDIGELTKYLAISQREEAIREETLFRQQLVIYGLTGIILLIAVTSYFIYKNARASKIANQLLALKSLRSQMNPHFIFNALNSVNHFVAQNDERTANRFLSEFSRLMRLVLENSQEDFIPLYKEHEIISLYLKLEHYRFRDKFDYELSIDDNINMETVELPPMLIQPYIENAVWHGLRYKDSKGHLSLHIKSNHNNLLVEVSDDGIGRKRSLELKTENQKKHTSTGLKNIQQRLKLINKVYNTNYQVRIEDIPGDGGTRVFISLPLHARKKQP